MERSGQPIEELRGVGEKTGKLFKKLGINTVEDLLQTYPRAYDAFEAPAAIGELKENASGSVAGILTKPADLLCINGVQMVSAVIKDKTGSLQLVWYHMPYIRTNLRTGVLYVFRGRMVKKNGRRIMQQPEIFSPEAYQQLVPSLQPIYNQTRGLGNKSISRAVAQALEQRQKEAEYLPKSLRDKYQLAECNFALKHIHFPKDREELLFARKRLVFDELFLFLIGVRRLKEKRTKKTSSYRMKESPLVEQVRISLPYRLTNAQERTWKEIKGDLCGEMAMNRLIQGDVGSGKTILAILALLETACNGCQGALMVPTEVLARQHYVFMVQLFSSQNIHVNVILVTGSITPKERRTAYEDIKNQNAQIIVGTHALIQEKIEYCRLALVITDEQHRFGVGQREALGEKSNGKTPHVMVMSATPIPRTLAIILYGDLDISVIDELPANRLPIKNCVVGTGYRKNAYAFISKQIAKGRQAYVICPMVEESEGFDAENVLDYTKRLKRELPSFITVEYLHGKMRGREKNQIMERFAAGEIQVLVSTTVVEVGVNVPNATVMMIENAERFGLAQLHQLRGRVGRGQHQSYCIMINCAGNGEAGERLEILNRSNDGFYIASEDLKLRGPGDIFGVRQSGEMDFKLADIFTDAALLKMVSEEVNKLLSKDPELSQEEHRELRHRLEIYMQERKEGVSL